MFKKIVAVAALVVSASQVQAVEVDLDLTSPESREDAKVQYKCSWWGRGGCTKSEDPYYAMTYNYETDGGELSVTASGWSYDREGQIEADYVGNWSKETGLGRDYGLGVEDEWTPEHAIDNNHGDYDMILLEFDQAVSLESVTAGWRSDGNSGYRSNGSADNSELSVLAFTGDMSAAQSFDGKEWNELLGEGWETAGDSQIQELNKAEGVNATGITSRYWLVGAYNSTINGAVAGLSDGNDFFKMTGVTVSVNPVPLPGSMLLFGAALLGFGAIRRRKKA